MAYLTHHELQKMHNCIRDIYSTMEITSLPTHIVLTVSKIIPSSIILYAKYSYRKIGETQENLCVEEMASIGKFDQMNVFAQHAHEHPFINNIFFHKSNPHPFREDIERMLRKRVRNYKQSLELSAVKISDALDNHKFRRLALFNEFFRPNNIEYQLGMPVLCGNGFHTALCFNRDKMDFSEKDRLILNLIGPHIMQAYKNAERYASKKDTLGSFKQLFEDNNCNLLKSLGLSFREAEIIYWVLQGKTNYEIAIILNIAPGTVKIHLEKIYRKLGVENRMAAAMIALEAFEKNR